MRGLVGLAAACAVLASFALVAPLRAQSSLTLRPPWNLVAAANGGSIDELAADFPSVTGIYRWDPAANAFQSWRRGVPDLLNTLDAVSEGDGLWVEVSTQASWPIGDERSVAAPPGAGWRLIGWAQADASAASVHRQLGSTRIVAFDAASQGFQTYDPNLPFPSLASVHRGAAIWTLQGGGQPEPIGLEPALGGRSFQQPVEFGAYPGGRVFVAEQRGDVVIMRTNGSEEETLLDLRNRVLFGGEQGLLSVALDPDFNENGYLYAYYSVAGDQRTRLSRFAAQDDSVNLDTELVILEQAQPFANHNGGSVRFGPDGYLYLGFGDGGSGGDPLGSGQDRSTWLGSLIRIDVEGATPNNRYDIPADNPFVNASGVLPEIWAYGLRNPWRMAFDSTTGDLWLADVGQNAIEEVNVMRAGGNFGWNRMEGDACFSPASGCDTSGLVMPVATYGHDQGCSVSGGVIYHGTTVPEITNAYLYSDFCSGTIWAINTVTRGEPVQIGNAGGNVSSFGMDSTGRVYVLVFGGPVLRVVSP